MWHFISDLKALKKVRTCSKEIKENYLKQAFEKKELKKPGLIFNLGLGLIGHWTTGLSCVDIQLISVSLFYRCSIRSLQMDIKDFNHCLTVFWQLLSMVRVQWLLLLITVVFKSWDPLEQVQNTICFKWKVTDFFFQSVSL